MFYLHVNLSLAQSTDLAVQEQWFGQCASSITPSCSCVLGLSCLKCKLCSLLKRLCKK